MNAAETYKTCRSDVARLLDVLGMELDRMDAEATKDPKCWGLAGNLGHIRERLVEIVAFASGKETSEVEEFLADAI